MREGGVALGPPGAARAEQKLLLQELRDDSEGDL